MNIVKGLEKGLYQSVLKLNASTCLLNQQMWRSGNQKTSRNKAPHEAKSEARWTSKLKGMTIEEEVTDKLILQREIVDPVWLMKEYRTQTYSLEDAIQYHKEIARPELFNNENGFLCARIMLDMTTKKKTKFMDNIKGVVYFPHYFQDGIQKEVVAICKKEEEIRAANEAGALFAGFEEILKKIDKGEITDSGYDFLVCTPETFPDVTLLKKKINRDKLPTLKNHMVTENIGDLVYKLHMSKDLASNKISDDKAILKIKIGHLKFEIPQLVENMTALVEKIRSFKRYQTNDFIQNCVLYAPPSTEKFQVDLSRYNKVEEVENKGKGKKSTSEEEDEEETTTTTTTKSTESVAA